MHACAQVEYLLHRRLETPFQAVQFSPDVINAYFSSVIGAWKADYTIITRKERVSKFSEEKYKDISKGKLVKERIGCLALHVIPI